MNISSRLVDLATKVRGGGVKLLQTRMDLFNPYNFEWIYAKSVVLDSCLVEDSRIL